MKAVGQYETANKIENEYKAGTKKMFDNIVETFFSYAPYDEWWANKTNVARLFSKDRKQSAQQPQHKLSITRQTDVAI